MTRRISSLLLLLTCCCYDQDNRILRSAIRLFPGLGSSDGPSTRRLVRTPGLLAGRDYSEETQRGFWGLGGLGWRV